MVRKPMMLIALSVLLGAQWVCAQEAQEAKPVRFEALVKVGEIHGAAGSALTALKPGADAPVEVIPYKAYPYGTVFTLAPEARVRLSFTGFTYANVRGPAVFVPRINEDWTAATLEVRTGDYNIAVDDRSLPGQFQTITPLGTFESMNGRFKLHLGEITGNALNEDCFSFRVLNGTARYQGRHFLATELTQANAFTSADTANGQATQLTGRVGEVKLDLPSGADKTTPFALQPGSLVKITRAKARASENWTVSVLTLYNNGKAKNYFAYVENRGEGFRTGELFDEVFPDENSEDSEGGEGQEDDTDADDLDNFDDGELL